MSQHDNVNAIGWQSLGRGVLYLAPISILPCLSKVFESQVNKQITDHVESHRTFSAVQSVFRAGQGCTSATLKVLNDIITAIDKRQYCSAVFIDLAKAFDSVNHRILIGRLNSLGAWFTNYFSDRVQCVKSEGLLSRPLAVSMGYHRIQFSDRLCIYQR